MILSDVTQNEKKTFFDYCYEGQITDVIIFTAYFDIETLEDLRRFLNKNAKKWPKKSALNKNCSIRIFSDLSNRRLLDQLSNQEKQKYSWIDNRYKKTNESDHENYRDSGIYFMKTGILFHPKCYLFTYANGESKIFLGSMNFTKNGRRAKDGNGNEEFLLSLSTTQTGEKTLTLKIMDDIYSYIKNNSKKIIKYTGPELKMQNDSLRDLFLSGYIWYETKENDSLFRLPIKIIAEDNGTENFNLHYAIDDQHSQTYNIKKVIGKITETKLISKTTESKKQFKPYLLSTSIGQWSPKEFKQEIEAILIEKSEAKSEEINKIIDVFNHDFDKLLNEILIDFQKHPQWGVSKKQIKKRLEVIKNKLLLNPEEGEEFNSYCRRLIYPWSSYPMVDIWQDSLAVSEFEESLKNELYYKLRKERYSKISKFFFERIMPGNKKTFNTVGSTKKRQANIDHWKFLENPVEMLKNYLSK
jgi:hypothetical protein